MMNRRITTLPIVCAAAMFALTACSDHGHDHSHDHGHSHNHGAPRASNVVSWPTLTQLDDLIHDADDMILMGEIAELRGILPEVRRLAIAVAEETIPANAHDPEEVALLQRDLLELVELLRQSDATDRDLARNVSGVIAITEEIMKSAGVPHGHPDEADSHDHHDHDHDHDHHH